VFLKSWDLFSSILSLTVIFFHVFGTLYNYFGLEKGQENCKTGPGEIVMRFSFPGAPGISFSS
jgi:hypothetical protein